MNLLHDDMSEHLRSKCTAAMANQRPRISHAIHQRLKRHISAFGSPDLTSSTLRAAQPAKFLVCHLPIFRILLNASTS